MTKVGILTLSDGRAFVHRDLVATNEQAQAQLAGSLENDGHDVVTGEIVWSVERAKSESRRLSQAGCDATIFNWTV